ncbi:MAG: O-antigen ligase family protein [Verrucomicrobiae bacterium]|nr:O-antigen ligase family protein [Verrucomicrobiae bacterium]
MKRKASFYPPLPERRAVAQTLFFCSGLVPLLWFGGSETGARVTVFLLLAAACLLEASVSGVSQYHPSRIALWLAGGMAAVMGLSLAPWPAAWASWLAPAQSRLEGELPAPVGAWLHLSMAPNETWQAAAVWMGGAATLYLAWFWSGEHRFRRQLRVVLLALGVLAAVLGVMDQIMGSDRIYGLRATIFPNHWGAFVNRNHFSHYMNVCGLFSLGLFFHFCFPVERGRQNRRYGAAALGIALLCLGCSVATTSKGGMVSLGTGLCLLAFGVCFRGLSGLRPKFMLLVLLAGAAAVLTYGRGSLNRVESYVKGNEARHEGRWEIWSDVWRMGRDAGARGIGPGAFETVFPAWQTCAGGMTVTHPENEYLQLWVEWGLAGTVVWVLAACFLAKEAWHGLSGRHRGWQPGAWAALAAAAVHASMDFPTHIPANAWIICALLGMCLHHHVDGLPSNEGDAAKNGFLFKFRCHPENLLLGVFLLGGAAVYAGCSRDFFSRTEDCLRRGDFQTAWNRSGKAVDGWPFYWRTHLLKGVAAAGLPGKTREAQRAFRAAQRLGQVNPEISGQAGMLFLKRSPAAAADFFETSVAVAAVPSRQLWKLMEQVDRAGGDAGALASAAGRDAKCWAAFFRYMSGRPDAGALLESWLEMGRDLWLRSPDQRLQVLGPLIERGMARQAAEAFRILPPSAEEEEFWQARAMERLGEWETSARIYERLWRKKNSPPAFEAFFPVGRQVLQRAALKADDLRYQRQVAESLAAQGNFEDAGPVWERIMAAEPDNARARYGLAAALSECGAWKRAAGAWGALAGEALKIQSWQR